VLIKKCVKIIGANRKLSYLCIATESTATAASAKTAKSVKTEKKSLIFFAE